MSIKKIIAVLLSIIVTIGFGPGISDVAYLMSAAQPQDAASDPNIRFISPRNVSYVTEEAFVGSLERSAGFDARLSFPNTISVLVPRDGMFVNMPISGNPWVEEGDPIATFSVVANELEIDEAALALELAQSAHKREIEALENTLADARARLEALQEDALARLEALQEDARAIATELRRAELAVAEAEAHLDFIGYNGEYFANGIEFEKRIIELFGDNIPNPLNVISYNGFAGMYIGGLASLIGHAFPVYYGFKGGKCVASTFFMVLCTEPLIALICLMFFVVIVWVTKFISVGSIMCVIIYPLILYNWTDLGLHNLIAIVIMLFVVFLHRANIKRLINGQENKLSFRKKVKEEEKT